MKEKIAKVGFELEGEFSSHLQSWLSPKGDMKEDGSVNTCSSVVCENLESGEFASKAYPIDQLDKALELLDTISKMNENAEKKFGYKRHYHWNHSAGFHIHVSFTTGKSHQIWSTQFADYFTERLKKELPEVYETRKNNRFCRIMKYTDEAIGFGRFADQSDRRYRFINFLPAFERHKTMEFRIFPANDPRELKKYINFTVGTIQDFFKKSNKLLKVQIEEPLKKKEDQDYQEDVYVKNVNGQVEENMSLNPAPRFSLFLGSVNVKPVRHLITQEIRPQAKLSFIPDKIELKASQIFSKPNVKKIDSRRTWKEELLHKMLKNTPIYREASWRTTDTNITPNDNTTNIPF